MVDFVGRVANGADHLGGYRNWVGRVGCPWYANRVQHGGRYHGLYRRTGPAGRRQPPEIGPAAGQRGEDGRQSQADHAPPARLLMSHPAGQDGPRDGARAAAADPRAQTAAPTGGRTGADSGAPAAAGGRTGSPAETRARTRTGAAAAGGTPSGTVGRNRTRRPAVRRQRRHGSPEWLVAVDYHANYRLTAPEIR